LWKAHFDGMYRDIHSNELEHIVLMHWRAPYSTWWTCCVDLWPTTNNKLLGKQNLASVPLTWKTFVQLMVLVFGCLCAFMKSFLAPQLWCDVTNTFNVWVFECVEIL
jgi:hypothetical protein